MANLSTYTLGMGMTMRAIFKRLVTSIDGTSAIEMGLICALIILAMLGALNNLANETNNMWSDVSNDTHNAVSEATS